MRYELRSFSNTPGLSERKRRLDDLRIPLERAAVLVREAVRKSDERPSERAEVDKGTDRPGHEPVRRMIVRERVRLTVRDPTLDRLPI
jgi:hypothetical protein